MKRRRKFLAWLLLLALIFTSIPAFPGNAKSASDKVISVLDYGADPTGEADSTEAIWNALQAAKEAQADGSSVTLDFPEGEYHIYKDRAQTREYHTSNTNSIENPVKTIGFLIEEHENLTIEGNGSLFMMHGNMMALAIVKSRNITLKDFSWDFEVPTVVEMTVTGVGSNFTDYYIPDCFPHTVSGNTIRWSSDLSPYTGQAYWSGSGHQPDGRSTYAVVGYHPDDEMARNYYPADGPLSNVSRIEEVDDNNVRVYYSSRSSAQSQNQKEGTIFELCGNAHRETAGAFTWESENVNVEDVNVHFMHGFGWLIQMSKDVYYRRCNLVPRENSGHTTVSFADGIHASGAAGELVFEDCNFANTHDDPLNLHGTFTRVESRMDDNTLTLKYIHAQQGGFPQYHVGDKVQFFTRDTLESTDGEAMYTVAEIIQDTDESSDKKTMIIRFEETLPTNLSDRISGQPKYVAENVTYAPAVTIRNCTFKNVATRGVLCTTRNKVLIEGNTFYNMSMATIYLSNDSDEWYESGPIRDMTIRNNTFYIKDIGRTAWNTAPAIYVHPVTKGGGLPDASNPIHKNITIEGNTFFMDLDRVVEAESVENLTFRNNKVYRMNPEVEIEIDLENTTISTGETAVLTVNATGNTNNGSIDNLFQFKACKNVVIEGNTYDDGLKLCAVADQATLNNGITVNDEEITVVTSATAVSAPVADVQYASTDPSVVKVDENRNVTGVSEGTAMVFAYYQWNDTIIRSNYVEISVEGEFEGEGAGSEDKQEPVVTYELNPAFSIVRGNDNHSYDADSIEITSEAGDLYQSDNTLKNLFLYTLDVDKSNLRASVKVEGLPVNESGKWDTASFILFAGEDDYYTIGKKSHYRGFSTVKERAQSATEEHGDAEHNSVESAWLGIVKEGNTIKLEYSLDGKTWATAKTYTDATFGNEYQLGFGSWTSTNSGRKATFSEFKVGTAKQSYAELKPVEILTVSSETVPEPDVPDVFVKFGTEIVFEENDAEEVTVSIPMEVQKIEMAYAFEDGLEGDVKISKNGTALAGNYKNSDSVIFDVADGDTIVIIRGEKEYTFVIECVASNVTTVDKIAIASLDYEVVPEDEKAFYAGETYKESGSVKVTVAENVGNVKILYGNLREALTVEKEGTTYSADYRLVDGLNSFYVQSVAQDGVTTKQYIVNIVYDAPAEPEIKLSSTTADNLKAGAIVGAFDVIGVEEEAVYTYALCEGNGDAHNDFFEIADGQLKVKKALTDGEVYQVRVKAVSGDSVMEASFAINAQRARTDYPVENMTAISDSQYLPGTANEGPDDYILDGREDTHWHTNWQTTEGSNVEKRWIGVSLAEATEIDGIRYLPRNYSGSNGAVTEYKAQYRATDDGEWIDLATGTWSANDSGWKLITFDAVIAKQVRVVGVHTYADSGNDAHMSAAEFRVTIAEKEEKPPVIPPAGEDGEVVRLFGQGRYETGYAVANELKEVLGVEKFEAVVVATGKNFADALAGSYLAVEKNAPILLTNGKDANVAELHDYIKANVKAGGTVYILGGDGAVPETVDAIEGYKVKRLFGDSRYDTNLAILEEAGVTGDEIIVATGKTFADSLSASAAKLPILLVKPNAALNDAQKAVLEGMKNIYIVGGDGAVSEAYAEELAAYADVTRVFGQSRYDTSVEVAKTFCGDVDSAVVASGKNFPDGLCGGPLAAALNAPLILTKDGGTDAAAGYVAEEAIAGGYVLGGDGALTDDTVVNVFALESADEILVK